MNREAVLQATVPLLALGASWALVWLLWLLARGIVQAT
jgi:hypothetical protein